MKNATSFVATLLTLTGIPAVGQAATYYVDNATGSNSNNGTSEATPFATIAKCTETMIEGDTCFVRGGTYNESGVRFRRSGTRTAPIQLLNYPNELPVLSCTGQELESNSFLFTSETGYRNPIGWIVVSGFEVRNCHDGMKFYNLHDTTIQHMWLHDNVSQGILGSGTRVVVQRNVIQHNGPHITAPGAHGMYAQGTDITVTNNLFYDSTGFGIQLNGTNSFAAGGNHPSAEFAESHNWIIANNTFAYARNRSGIVHWGSRCNNTRIENNIFYENAVTASSAAANGVDFWSGLPSDVTIRNNFAYASGSGGEAFITSNSASEGVNYTQSDNVVNVSGPAFVDAPATAPRSPNFTLTAGSPAIGVARENEFLRNATLTVGAFDTVGTPTASIAENMVTLTFPISNAVPIQNLSAAGVTVNCTGSACPDAPTVNAVKLREDTDGVVDVTLADGACDAEGQTWTISYESSTGSWTANDNIGPWPGLHQKIFSFTDLAVANECGGTGGGSDGGADGSDTTGISDTGGSHDDGSANTSASSEDPGDSDGTAPGVDSTSPAGCSCRTTQGDAPWLILLAAIPVFRTRSRRDGVGLRHRTARRLLSRRCPR